MDTERLLISYMAEMRNQIDFLTNEIRYLKQCVLATECHSSLRKFKNCMKNKDVAIIATGPSVKYYKPQSKCINVGINGAIYLKNILLDYIFLQDLTTWQTNNEDLNKDVYLYTNKKGTTIKFWGIHQSQPLRVSINKRLYPIPPYYVQDNNKNYIYILSKHNMEMSHCIDLEPFEDMGSTTLSALQFILYCNPKTIYLVGCDCTSGYATDEGYTKSDNHYQREIWINLVKPFLKTYYPYTKIISINPVGLKGVFPEIMQEGFSESDLFKTSIAYEENEIIIPKKENAINCYYKLIYNLCVQGIKVINIYCAGLICDDLLNFILNTDIKIKFIFDQKAKYQNITISNLKVYDFDSFPVASLKECSTFVIASFSFTDVIKNKILKKFQGTSISPKIYQLEKNIN